MKRRSAVKAMALTSLSTPFFFSQGFTSIKKLLSTETIGFKSNWENWPDMKWIGPEFWGNRLQDWEISGGKALCNISSSNRALHILTHQLGSNTKDFQQSVLIDWKNQGLVGNAAVFGKGLDAGVTGTGQLMIGEKLSQEKLDLSKPIFLTLKSAFSSGKYSLTLSGSTARNDKNSVELTADGIAPGDLQGNLA